MKKSERIWVYPEFKKILKINAVSKGKSIIQYTEDIAKESDPLEKLKRELDEKYKKKSFDFP